MPLVRAWKMRFFSTMRVVFPQPRGQVPEKVLHQAVPPLRQVLGDAADAKPVRVHPRPADRLDDVEHMLAIGEHVEDGRQGAQVLGEGAVEDQVRGDPEQLGHHDPDHFRPVRHLDARQHLHGQQIGQVVHDAAEVIDAVRVGDVRVPGLAFAHLFGAAMVKADLRHDVHDFLVVQLGHQPQHAVRARMLRPDVQEHQIALADVLRQVPSPRDGIPVASRIRRTGPPSSRTAACPSHGRDGPCAAGAPSTTEA